MEADVRISSNAVSYVPGYLPGEKPKNPTGQMMLAAARIKAQATASHSPSGDWAFAERIEALVRTKELPSYRTEIGAGRELIKHYSETALEHEQAPDPGNAR
jgi:hypothetical protein